MDSPFIMLQNRIIKILGIKDKTLCMQIEDKDHYT
ncbi:hypothetical protein CLOBY_31800 [Clostridium saccharobutylicum]|nr:hypothetical protein CLOSC_32420 [Clostridium saccharobutylicum]AQS01421.1 hypothetical protein CSACC_32500 [Clostridium saccharobutylicum]AQS11030.1 hypothetical protein CLOBY_31800 [Clostridium saccharobutylicum]AQS15404.1 hypothetical protein CLOSACC_32500 [Clostridium saccharobutylicum]MBA2906174.1 hypothetical protein [Clostridium saccharobutylicum]